jgi:hypothetical protein
MPMEYNPRALADVWQLPPGAFLEGQRMLPMMQARDETAYQKSLQDMQFEAEAQPHKLQQYKDASAMSQAQLPGVQAGSRTAVRNDAEHALFTPERIKSAMGKFRKEDVETFGRVAGEGTLQMAGEVRLNPIGSTMRVRDRFQQLGMQQLWNPAWDNLPPDQLANALEKFGKHIQESVPSLYGKALIADTNNSTKLGVAGINAQARERSAQISAAARRDAKAATASGDPKTYQAAASKWLNIAQQMEMSGDFEGALEARKAAQEFSNLNHQAIVARGQASGAGKIDAGGVAGLPTMPAPQAPVIAQPPANQPPPDTPQRQSGPVTPAPGTVYKGYKFKGGNPADKNNWEKQ